jgi:hypothetical protein
MEWKSKFEEEDRQRAEAEKRKREQDERAKDEEATRFKPYVSRLGPLLEQEVADVAQRLGIRLRLSADQRAITVAAPRRQGSILRSPFPYSISLFQSDGSSIRVRAIDDQQINRNPDMMPDDMSSADYFGTENTVVDTRETMDDLMSGDLARLMEWLVGMCRSSGNAPAPQLRGGERAQAGLRRREQEKKGRSTSAGWCLALGILGVFVPFVGPVALIWGIQILSARIKAGHSEGRTAAAWAIGLGALGSLSSLARLGSLLRN